jgi:hypothetical protein
VPGAGIVVGAAALEDKGFVVLSRRWIVERTVFSRGRMLASAVSKIGPS